MTKITIDEDMAKKLNDPFPTYLDHFYNDIWPYISPVSPIVRSSILGSIAGKYSQGKESRRLYFYPLVPLMTVGE